MRPAPAPTPSFRPDCVSKLPSTRICPAHKLFSLLLPARPTPFTAWASVMCSPRIGKTVIRVAPPREPGLCLCMTWGTGQRRS